MTKTIHENRLVHYKRLLASASACRFLMMEKEVPSADAIDDVTETNKWDSFATAPCAALNDHGPWTMDHGPPKQPDTRPT